MGKADVLFGLSLISGLRAAYGPALLSQALLNRPGAEALPWPASLLADPRISKALLAMSAGELVVDKLPGIPPRTAPPALGMRFASGGLVGAAAAQASGRRWQLGALVGVLAAGAAAYLGLAARSWTGRRLDLPDPLVGALEDTLALATGLALLTAARRRR